MQALITGSPGTGKTTVAKKLAESIEHKYFNEHDLALDKGIGKWDHESSELVIDPKKLETAATKILSEHPAVILEGHVFCETALNLDLVVVLRVHPEILEVRLESKGYKGEKIQDNVFCEGIDYCKKHALRNYGEEKVIEVRNEKSIKETLSKILMELRERDLLE